MDLQEIPQRPAEIKLPEDVVAQMAREGRNPVLW